MERWTRSDSSRVQLSSAQERVAEVAEVAEGGRWWQRVAEGA